MAPPTSSAVRTLARNSEPEELEGSRRFWEHQGSTVALDQCWPLPCRGCCLAEVAKVRMRSSTINTWLWALVWLVARIATAHTTQARSPGETLSGSCYIHSPGGEAQDAL